MSVPIKGRAPVLAPVLTLAWILLGATLLGAQDHGQSLEIALVALSDAGLDIVYTSHLVRPEMKVEATPAGSTPRQRLDQVLAPHGLMVRQVGDRLVVVEATTETGTLGGRIVDDETRLSIADALVIDEESGAHAVTAGDGTFRIPNLPPGQREINVRRPGFVAPSRVVEIVAGLETNVTLSLVASPMTVVVIDVRSAAIDPERDRLSTIVIDSPAESLDVQPVNDVIRAMASLPGAVGDDVSARFTVRGGRDDEVQVRIDGLEIAAPYHLQDFNDALSNVAPSVLGSARLMTGGFGVAYGDRMGGVLDLTTLDPTWRRRSSIGLSIFNLQLGSSGLLPSDRGNWLASVRVGSLEAAFRFDDQAENPRFGDAFGKLGLSLGTRNDLAINLLRAGDRLNFVETNDDGDERFRTRYTTTYGWLTLESVWRANLHSVSRISFSRIQRDREGAELRLLDAFEAQDRRRHDEGTIAQDWQAQIGTHQLRWGFDVRTLDVQFDYRNTRALGDPVAGIRTSPAVGETRFNDRFRGSQIALYVSDQVTFTNDLTAEIGVRFDRNSVLDEDRLSPRLNLAHAAGSRTVLRAGWGIYDQSHRLYELEVEDGETSFAETERATEFLFGIERTLRTTSFPLTLRAELYRREVRDPRARYENLFDPLGPLLELEVDRVRIAPERSRTEGLEVRLNGAIGRKLDYELGYALSRARDRIDGATVPRSRDQRHALSLDLSYRGPRNWDFGLEARVHTGWPTTGIGGRLVSSVDGGTRIEPVLGPLYGDRLQTYRRFDLKARRSFSLQKGRLELAVEIQNVFNTINVRGFTVTLEADDAGFVNAERRFREWTGILPFANLTWHF